MELKHGIGHNKSQFIHQLIQVLLVGLTIGMTRTVVPALADNGLAFTAVAERAGPFWSGRAPLPFS